MAQPIERSIAACDHISLLGAKQEKPFAHIVYDRIYTPSLADALLNWLETGVPWYLHESSFYEQYECDLLEVPRPPGCAPLFTNNALAALKTQVEAAFGIKLADHVKVVAHKLVTGQGIGLHNDDPDGDLETETHRLIVQLNRGWRDENGGHLLLFNSRNPSDIFRIVRPVHNTGVAFELSQKSYHAVNDINGNARYTVIYSFWQMGAKKCLSTDLRSIEAEDTGGSRFDGQDQPDASSIEKLVDFLRTAGADDVHHANQDLLSHLVSTYKILRRWKCADHICMAGLFHSVYGNAAFDHAIISLEKRQLIRNLVGSEAEQLVYTFCATTEEDLCANLDHGPPYFVRSRIDSTNIPLTKEDLAGLIPLVLANSLEQLSRVTYSRKRIEDERAVLEKVNDLVPGDALVELRWAYGQRNSFESRLMALEPEAQARVEKILQEALAMELPACG